MSATPFQTKYRKGNQRGIVPFGYTCGNLCKILLYPGFEINGNTISEKEAQQLELEALEYHIRAMATLAGIIELEKQLENQSII